MISTQRDNLVREGRYLAVVSILHFYDQDAWSPHLWWVVEPVRIRVSIPGRKSTCRSVQGCLTFVTSPVTLIS